ncbi:hypothetical protein LINPERPRIM_LOCUS37783, partial [Linum perenne]
LSSLSILFSSQLLWNHLLSSPLNFFPSDFLFFLPLIKSTEDNKTNIITCRRITAVLPSDRRSRSRRRCSFVRSPPEVFLMIPPPTLSRSHRRCRRRSAAAVDPRPPLSLPLPSGRPAVVKHAAPSVEQKGPS